MGGLQETKKSILGHSDMALTRDFREGFRARAQRDPQFRAALLRESIDTLLDGDVQTGKSLLKDYINATMGFEELAKRTDIHIKSLMRMFSTNGNPTMENLFGVLRCLQEAEGLHLKVRAA